MAGNEKEQQGSPAAPSPDLRTKDGAPYEVPVEGSLGLLALGHVGLMAWRKARAERKKNKGQQSEG